MILTITAYSLFLFILLGRNKERGRKNLAHGVRKTGWSVGWGWSLVQQETFQDNRLENDLMCFNNVRFRFAKQAFRAGEPVGKYSQL